ncbi:MAG: type II secretion system F family protein [Desulfatirhabdiaceae bacterium]
MNIYLVALALFFVSVIVIELVTYGYATFKNPDRAEIRRKLHKMRYRSQNLLKSTDITRKTFFSEIPFLNRFLKNISLAHTLQRLLYQANAKYSTGFYFMVMLLLGIVGFYLFSFQNLPQPIPVLAGGLFGLLPLIYLKIKRRSRMEKFLRQLPEALDMLTSSLRAGHALSTAMKLVAEEFDDPLGPEFDVTLDEINFGVSMPDALRKMTERVTCEDLNFFVVAVILQRETGGNLAQILENISLLIRDRFKLFGKIRALAAEGVLSMYVLLALPIGMAGILKFINPGYINTLFENLIGRIMVGFALVMMAIGSVVMKNMIRIKV